MDVIPSEMFRGHLDTIILLSLVHDDKHTNQIREEIEKRSDGQFELKQGTFYSCLQRIVKQGYVTEYRASTPEGRRKFLQLTEKGKNYIDDNKDKWEVSRSVVNTLLETPEKKQPKPKPVEKADDSILLPPEPIDIDKQLRDFLNSPEPVKVEPESTENEVISENVEIIDLEKLAQSSGASSKNQPEPINVEPSTEESKPQQILDPLVDANISPESYEVELLTGEFSRPLESSINNENNENIESQTQSLKVEESAENFITEAIETVQESPIQEENIHIEAEKEPEPIVTEPQPRVIYEDIYEDDSFDSATTIKHDYKPILQKLFPKNKSSDKHKYDEDRVIIYEAGTTDVKKIFEEQEPQVYAEPKIERPEPTPVTPSHAAARQKATQNAHEYEVNDEPIVPIVNNDSEYDFSDIKSLAKVEGFKVNIASGTTKRAVNSILTNKLSAVSSLIYYLIALAEIWVLAYFTSQPAGLTFRPFIIFAIVLGLFPLTSLIIYFVDPKRKVASIPTMKSVIELCIVVMLNLVLIMIVFSILAEVDFANTAQVLKYVVYPSIIILNVPIYFIIKYLNLDNRKFYS